MATEPWAAQTARAEAHHCSDERWRLMWSQREHLLKVARRRSMSVEDAEDAVHEAMLRAMEQPHLDEQRLPAWLTTVTMRLCVDRYRQVTREAEVGSRATLAVPAPPPVEELVCDRDEAGWLARRSGELPGRQAEALWLKSEELDVGQVAHRMGLSYRTVESLLARARRTLRNSLAGTLAVVLWLCGRGRPRTGTAVQSAAVVSTVATLTVLGIAVPGGLDGAGTEPGRQGAEAAVERSAGDGGEAAGTPVDPAGELGSGGGAAAGPGADGARASLLPVPLPALGALPPLRVDAAPDVTGLPRLAGLLGLPQVLSAPKVPAVPGDGVSGASGFVLPSESAVPPALSGSTGTGPNAGSEPSRPAPSPVPGAGDLTSSTGEVSSDAGDAGDAGEASEAGDAGADGELPAEPPARPDLTATPDVPSLTGPAAP